MSRLVGAAWAVLLVLTGQAGAEPARPVVACETLVTLRLLMGEGGLPGEGGPDHAAASARLDRHPACRLIPRDRVGAAEQRAMIGGAPFECLAIRDEGRCAWIMP